MASCHGFLLKDVRWWPWRNLRSVEEQEDRKSAYGHGVDDAAGVASERLGEDAATQIAETGSNASSLCSPRLALEITRDNPDVYREFVEPLSSEVDPVAPRLAGLPPHLLAPVPGKRWNKITASDPRLAPAHAMAELRTPVNNFE